MAKRSKESTKVVSITQEKCSESYFRFVDSKGEFVAEAAFITESIKEPVVFSEDFKYLVNRWVLWFEDGFEVARFEWGDKELPFEVPKLVHKYANSTVGSCRHCSQERKVALYTYHNESFSLCFKCSEFDNNAYDLECRKIKRKRKRNAIENIAKRLKILDRIEMVNEGTCLLDGRVYFYAQTRNARIKGVQKYYQMRGFEHFVEVFGNQGINVRGT